MNIIFKLTALFIATLIISGCAPKSIEMVKLNTSSLAERQLQTKHYNSKDEVKILSASVSTLQDMGFNIDEINRDYGVVTCSKTRDAREVGQQIGYFFLALLGGAQAMNAADHTQVIRATVVITPKEKLKEQTDVRLTVMRIMKNHLGNVIGVETIKDKEIYQKFFDKLSKSVFIEEQNI